jgi:predicted Zn-dependent protease
MAAPSLSDLRALAARALAALEGEAQATAWWERRLAVGEHGVSYVEQLSVDVVVLRDGRVGSATTSAVDAEGLARAAAAAAAHAELDREPVEARCLPEPARARPHHGWDPAIVALDPAAVAAELAAAAGERLAIEWRAGAGRVAIASSRGVDAAEERSFAAAEVAAPGRPVAAAIGPARIDLTALVAEAEAGFHEGAPATVDPGEYPVVLGPIAVAQVLEELKPDLAGPDAALAARRGVRVAASAINLSDSPRFPGTLPRSVDAEGVPRHPVPLIQDGVAHRVVSDTASGGSTGHATRPAHSEPWPDHLVLIGGGAADEDELCRPLQLGLHIPAFLLTLEGGWRLDGARFVEGGVRTDAATGLADLDPLAVLAATEALSAHQRLVPTDDDSALTIGATLCPALRAHGGVTIV